MKRWPIFLVYFLEVAVVLTTIYYEPTWCVRGKLWGEAFYDGKPTSWWRAELDLWEVTVSPSPPQEPKDLVQFVVHRRLHQRGTRAPRYVYSRRQSDWEKIQDRWLPSSDEKEVEWRLLEVFRALNGPPLLNSTDEDREPVLRQLLDDPSPKIRRLARIGLGMEADKEE